jgi:hypothetical protein
MLEKLNVNWQGVSSEGKYSKENFVFFVTFSRRGTDRAQQDGQIINRINVMFLTENISYYEGNRITPSHKEPIESAAELLQQKGEIIHPEYLKWINPDKSF